MKLNRVELERVSYSHPPLTSLPFLSVVFANRVGSWSELGLHLPLQLGSFLPATGRGCPRRGSRNRGIGGFRGTQEQVVTGKNERGFDVKGGAIRFG